jgi:hypothetical protein
MKCALHRLIGFAAFPLITAIVPAQQPTSTPARRIAEYKSATRPIDKPFYLEVRKTVWTTNHATGARQDYVPRGVETFTLARDGGKLVRQTSQAQPQVTYVKRVVADWNSWTQMSWTSVKPGIRSTAPLPSPDIDALADVDLTSTVTKDNCGRPREGQFAGFRTVTCENAAEMAAQAKSNRTHRLLAESTYVPSLNWVIIGSREVYSEIATGKVISEMVVFPVQLRGGKPDPALFEIPVNSTEAMPSEVEMAFTGAISGEPECPKCLSDVLQMRDTMYLRNRETVKALQRK